MRENYLEVTFRHGRPIAAYYYLPREANQKSARTRRVEWTLAARQPKISLDLSQ